MNTSALDKVIERTIETGSVVVNATPINGTVETIRKADVIEVHVHVNGTPTQGTPTTLPTLRVGTRVNYTSKGGRTASYKVGWVGNDRFTGEARCGLELPGKRKMFFVAASACTPATTPTRKRRTVRTPKPKPTQANAAQWEAIAKLREQVKATDPILARLAIAGTFDAASDYIRLLNRAAKGTE